MKSSKGHPSSRGICKEFAGKLLANAARAWIITDSFACHQVRLATLAPNLRNFIKKEDVLVKSIGKAGKAAGQGELGGLWALGGMELLPVRCIAGVSGDLPPCSARELSSYAISFCALPRAGLAACVAAQATSVFNTKVDGAKRVGACIKDIKVKMATENFHGKMVFFVCSYTCLCVWVFVCL